MANIDQVKNNTQQFISKENKKTKTDPGANTFKQTFGQVLENMESSKMETVQTEGLTELSPINFKLPDQSISISNKTEKLLSLIETYSDKLADNSISLKDIDSLLKEIQTDAQSLLQKVESSPDADEQIKNIAKELGVFANTEQIKFQRGDYLS